MGFALEVAVAIVILVGLVGTIIPILPGLVLIEAAILGWAVVDGGGWIRWSAVLVCAALMVLGYVLGTIVPGRRANDSGASAAVLLAGAVGMVVGFFVIPVIGLIVGGVSGVFVAELIRSRDLARAWELTWETLKGFGIAVAVQFGAGLLMLAVWLAAVAVS